MGWLKKFDYLITKTLEGLITVFFMIITGMVFLLAVLRYLFKTSIIGANEFATFLFIYCSALGAAVMVRHREHIKISFFIEKLPIVIKKIILTINYVLIGILNGFFAYLSFGWIKDTWAFKSQITKIPFWAVEVSIPIGCGIVVVYCLYNILLIHTNSDDFYLESHEADLELKDALKQVHEFDKEKKKG